MCGIEAGTQDYEPCALPLEYNLPDLFYLLFYGFLHHSYCLYLLYLSVSFKELCTINPEQTKPENLGPSSRMLRSTLARKYEGTAKKVVEHE